MSIITEDDFVSEWGAHASPTGDLFEFDQVKDHPVNTVWTVVDTDENHWIAVPGFHIVNKLGYVLTTKPWTDDSIEAFWFEDDLEDEDE